MKKIYDEPKLNVVLCSLEDVIRTSTGGENGDDWAKDSGFGGFVSKD